MHCGDTGNCDVSQFQFKVCGNQICRAVSGALFFWLLRNSKRNIKCGNVPLNLLLIGLPCLCGCACAPRCGCRSSGQCWELCTA